MSKIMDAKTLMKDLSIRELRILKTWISDEIYIKEKNEKKHPRVREEMSQSQANTIT